MGVAFESVKAGDVLWDCRYTKAGNTTMRRWSCWTLVVKSIDHEKGRAVVSWNGNAEETVYRGYFKGESIKRTKRPDPSEARRATPTGGVAGGPK